jgi:hypothetical protein
MSGVLERRDVPGLNGSGTFYPPKLLGVCVPH